MYKSISLSALTSLEYSVRGGKDTFNQTSRKTFDLNINLPLTIASFELMGRQIDEFVDIHYVFHDLVLRERSISIQTGGLFTASYKYSYESVSNRTNEPLSLENELPLMYTDKELEKYKKNDCGYYNSLNSIEEQSNLYAEYFKNENYVDFENKNGENFWYEYINAPINQRLVNAKHCVFEVGSTKIEPFAVDKISYRQTYNWLEPRRIGEFTPHKRILSSVEEQSTFTAFEEYLIEVLDQTQNQEQINITLGNSEGELSCQPLVLSGVYSQVEQNKTADEISTATLQLLNKIT